MQDTLSKAATKISKKYAKIEIKPAPTKTGEKTYFVASEPDLLQWVLSALIENILHASESKEGILDLEYVVVEQEERLLLELRNSLDTKICCELSELFMPFVSYSKEKRTLGLGLTVAHAILTRLNASIELEEQELKDSFCFVARLSLPKAAIKSAQQLPPGASSNLRSQQLQILLVEDEESVSTAIKKVLDYVFRESLDYQCLIMNGAEAQRYIGAGERFDLIICDYNLESCKGDQILRLVERCCPENRDKFILCSGDRFSEAEKQSINCPILAKPFEMDEFLSLIFKILNK